MYKSSLQCSSKTKINIGYLSEGELPHAAKVKVDYIDEGRQGWKVS